MCNVKNKINIFFIISSKPKMHISKVMRSCRAYPAVKFTGSFPPGSLTCCQTLQAEYWWGHKHWPTLIKLLVWLFPILYYNSIHTHTQDAYADQSVLVTSPHSCNHRSRVLSEEVSSSCCGFLLFLSVYPLTVKQAVKGSTGWQQITVKGLSCGSRHCVTSFLGSSVWFGSLNQLVRQS